MHTRVTVSNGPYAHQGHGFKWSIKNLITYIEGTRGMEAAEKLMEDMGWLMARPPRASLTSPCTHATGGWCARLEACARRLLAPRDAPRGVWRGCVLLKARAERDALGLTLALTRCTL